MVEFSEEQLKKFFQLAKQYSLLLEEFPCLSQEIKDCIGFYIASVGITTEVFINKLLEDTDIPTHVMFQFNVNTAQALQKEVWALLGAVQQWKDLSN